MADLPVNKRFKKRRAQNLAIIALLSVLCIHLHILLLLFSHQLVDSIWHYCSLFSVSHNNYWFVASDPFRFGSSFTAYCHLRLMHSHKHR